MTVIGSGGQWTVPMKSQLILYGKWRIYFSEQTSEDGRIVIGIDLKLYRFESDAQVSYFIYVTLV